MSAWMQDWSLRVTKLLDHATRQHGNREIVTHWPDGSETRTDWRGIGHDARRLARALQRLGVQPGDRVATLAMNHARHLSVWYGTIGMGGIVHTINPRLFDEQLAYIINHAEDAVLFYDAAFGPLVERLKPVLSSVRHFICFDGPDGYQSLIGAEDGAFDWVEGNERDPCMLCYTSGTTGHPKGVMYEHRSTVLHAMGEVAPDAFNLSARSSILPVVPMFHAASWGLPFAAAAVGSKLVFSAVNEPAVLCDLLEREGVTHCAAVPTIWLGIRQYLEMTGRMLPSLQLATIGGAAAPRTVIEWLTGTGSRVLHAWGMTETSPVGTLGAPLPGWDDLDADTQVDFLRRQGRPPFGVELRIVDDSGAPLPHDGATPGNLQIRGPWIVGRYYRTEEMATDADQWFGTGDIAKIHPDGMMQLTDRAKDLIKSGGEWISSVDLENAAVGCLGVAEAAAIAIPHPKWDERPVLIVVRKPGADVTAEDIRAHLTTHVAKWWLPDAIEFVEALPHTATGKVLKTALREQFRDYRLV